MQRALDRGEFPNAYRADGPAGEGTGPWMIPKDDLIAEGFVPGGGRTEIEPEPEHTTEIREHSRGPRSDGPTPDEVADLADKLAKAETEAADYRRRAEVAEAIAEERGAALEDTRLALRALIEGTGGRAPSEMPPVASVTTPEGAQT